MMQRYPDGIDKPGFFKKLRRAIIPIGLRQPLSKELEGLPHMQ